MIINIFFYLILTNEKNNYILLICILQYQIASFFFNKNL